MAWNDDRIAALKSLYKAGHSAGQIAAELGCSRNAVIGKINRLGIRNRLDMRAKPGTPRTREETGRLAIETKMSPFLPPDPLTPAVMRRCTILQLTDKICHFPIGDPREPGFHFCGNDGAGDGVPYCPYHARMSYQLAADRRAGNPRGSYYGPQV
jgi:GcrA cell cycle regulator